MDYSHFSSVKPSVPSLTEHLHCNGEGKMTGSVKVSAHSFIARVIPARKAMKARHVKKKKKKKEKWKKKVVVEDDSATLSCKKSHGNTKHLS